MRDAQQIHIVLASRSRDSGEKWFGGILQYRLGSARHVGGCDVVEVNVFVKLFELSDISNTLCMRNGWLFVNVC